MGYREARVGRERVRPAQGHANALRATCNGGTREPSITPSNTNAWYFNPWYVYGRRIMVKRETKTITIRLWQAATKATKYMAGRVMPTVQRLRKHALS